MAASGCPRPVPAATHRQRPGNAAPAAAPDGRLPAAEDEQLALDDVAGIYELARLN
ncbi:Os06g0578400 [Oryza sativa Japonica Group]|uniref:Os06g0578400 protein n=1 Tax=Oryza sativa subsp. japonica TaxID=39947 RepID=Q0DBC7_ORYSJ|nr:Os06g0578400 [Oryza sativa Japonica Group]|eukprot:NP_001057932.2 Os06g0578400 [Oryza sativa Japonica Group]